MNIETRIMKLEKSLRTWRVFGVAGLLGMALLIIGLAAAAFKSNPLLAVCIPLAIACCIPNLLSWHALTVERRILEKLNENHNAQS
ncbi:MAG TPA: hypothetical protein VGE41_02370 [Verrucomicrobiae bacterium]